MEAALIVTWDHPVRGREQEALQVFMDIQAFYEDKIQAGEVESRDVFFAHNGRGLSIVRGDSQTLQEMIESDEYAEFANRAILHVDGYETDIWAAGDEINRRIESYGKAIAGL